MGTCTRCGRQLVSVERYYTNDQISPHPPDPSGGKSVIDWDCPKCGVVWSITGGICGTYNFIGGPLDGKELIVSPGEFIREEERDGKLIFHVYQANYDDHENRFRMLYQGERDA